MEDCETFIFEKIRCGTKKGDEKRQGFFTDIGDVEVVCVFIFYHLVKEKEPESWKKLHVREGGEGGRGGVESSSLQHLQVMMTKLPQKKLGMASSVVSPTMYLARNDIKTPFAEATPRHVAEIIERHNTHRLIFRHFCARCAG